LRSMIVERPCSSPNEAFVPCVPHPIAWTQELLNHAAASVNDFLISRGDRHSNGSSIHSSLYRMMNSPMISLAYSSDSKSCR